MIIYRILCNKILLLTTLASPVAARGESSGPPPWPYKAGTWLTWGEVETSLLKGPISPRPRCGKSSHKA